MEVRMSDAACLMFDENLRLQQKLASKQFNNLTIQPFKNLAPIHY